MSKNGTEKSGMTSCKECGCSLKSENLARHLSKVHKIELKEDEIEKLVAESNKGVPTQKNDVQPSPTKSLSSRGLSSGSKKLSKKEKRDLRQHNDTKKAELRKLELLRRKRRNVVFASIAVLALVGMGFSYNMFVLNGEEGSSNPTATAIPQDEFGEIVIPKAEIEDDANFYKYDADGTEIRAFGVRGSDGEEHIALDACDSCYAEKKGYRQVGENMKCNNCGKEFAINSIGTENVEGGCWPSFLEISEDGDDIVLKGEELEKKKFMFE